MKTFIFDIWDSDHVIQQKPHRWEAYSYLQKYLIKMTQNEGSVWDVSLETTEGLI
jgi:hypothetical protein